MELSSSRVLLRTCTFIETAVDGVGLVLCYALVFCRVYLLDHHDHRSYHHLPPHELRSSAVCVCVQSRLTSALRVCVFTAWLGGASRAALLVPDVARSPRTQHRPQSPRTSQTRHTAALRSQQRQAARACRRSLQVRDACVRLYVCVTSLLRLNSSAHCCHL